MTIGFWGTMGDLITLHCLCYKKLALIPSQQFLQYRRTVIDHTFSFISAIHLDAAKMVSFQYCSKYSNDVETPCFNA